MPALFANRPHGPGPADRRRGSGRPVFGGCQNAFLCSSSNRQQSGPCGHGSSQGGQTSCDWAALGRGGVRGGVRAWTRSVDTARSAGWMRSGDAARSGVTARGTLAAARRSSVARATEASSFCICASRSATARCVPGSCCSSRLVACFSWILPRRLSTSLRCGDAGGVASGVDGRLDSRAGAGDGSGSGSGSGSGARYGADAACCAACSTSFAGRFWTASACTTIATAGAWPLLVGSLFLSPVDRPRRHGFNFTQQYTAAKKMNTTPQGTPTTMSQFVVSSLPQLLPKYPGRQEQV